jgi:hypothetical protein
VYIRIGEPGAREQPRIAEVLGLLHGVDILEVQVGAYEGAPAFTWDEFLGLLGRDECPAGLADILTRSTARNIYFGAARYFENQAARRAVEAALAGAEPARIVDGAQDVPGIIEEDPSLQYVQAEGLTWSRNEALREYEAGRQLHGEVRLYHPPNM